LIAAGLAAFLLSSATAQPQPATDPQSACAALTGDGPLLLRQDNLIAAKSAVSAKNANVLPAYYALLSRAERAMDAPLYSVTEKPGPPPGGDLHDYWSIGPYWWPNPKSSDGLPYIRRDGETNPERNSEKFDRRRMQNMRDAVIDLSLAGYFSGDARFGAKATTLLDAWFLDEETRMRPRLRYAQSIPGVTDGRDIGIIDTSIFIEMIDAILLLRQEGAISDEQLAELRQWFADYTRWLTTSEMALSERARANNHGTFYDAQTTAFAIFSRNCALAERIFEDTKLRIASQITPTGEMPLELSRTRSLHYSVVNLEAFSMIARLNEHLGADLYSYRAANGASLIASLRFLAPYAAAPETWPHKEIGSDGPLVLWRLLRMALTTLDSKALTDAEATAVGRDASDIAMLTHYLGD
jgi:hypothetical protein